MDIHRPIDVNDILARHGRTRGDMMAALNIAATTLRAWHRGYRLVSVRHAIMAEEKLGIPRHELRPDLWPPPAKARPKMRAVA